MLQLEGGSLTVEGDLWQLPSGVIALTVGAGVASGLEPRMSVGQTLHAGGVLHVQFDPGLVPAAGQTFDVLDFVTIDGAFAIEFPKLPATLRWDSSQLLIDGTLRVVNADSIGADDEEARVSVG
jgi:hypothetical protein